MSDFRSIAQETPGVSMKTSGPGQTEFEMRGLTATGGFSPTVGFYVDDAPLTAPAQAAQGKVVIDPDLYDLNRVEVLRGPQGTLYGSGSMGGTIKLVTNAPQLNTVAASRPDQGFGYRRRRLQLRRQRHAESAARARMWRRCDSSALTNTTPAGSIGSC